MTITGIKRQVKNTERASIYVDGKYSFSLTLDQLLGQRLRVGMELDEAELKNLKKLSDEGKLRMRVLEWLLRRPHATRELRDYLWRKKVEPDMAEALIEEYTAKGYLNDLAFARSWVESRRGFRKRSNRVLKLELRSKGISDASITEVLADSGEAEDQALRELIEKKRRQTRYRDPDKLKAFLLRQGYGYSSIAAALEDGE